jgi:hypothetical protein
MNASQCTNADYKEMVQDAAEDLRAYGIKRPTTSDIKRHIKMIHGVTLPSNPPGTSESSLNSSPEPN